MVNYTDILTGVMLMAVGSMGSAVVWGIRAVFKMRKDLDAAFFKIRAIEQKEKLCQALSQK